MQQKSVLSGLHASTNVHPFIFRLPTETLENIFIQCANDYHCEYDGRPIFAAPSWVNVSYVCRRWRDVALNCATIWAYVFITSQRWTEELLARSRQASLQIRISLLDDDETRCLDTAWEVLDHLERIQELRLEVPGPYDDEVISKLSSRAPRLQNLKLTLPPDAFPDWPSLLFDGVPPALHTLELSDCAVPLSAFKLNALTTLSLCYVPEWLQQDIEEFLAMMVYMKDLKHLYLNEALTSATGFLSSAVFRTFEKIDLPHLSRLRVCAPLSTTVALLSCINIPLKTTVKLECDSEPDFTFDNHALLCSLLTEGPMSSSTIRSLVISTSHSPLVPTLTFSAYERYEPDFTAVWYEVWDSNVPLQITLNLSGDDPDQDRIISNICCSVSLSNVRSLFVMTPPFSPAFWGRMLSHFQDVRCIKLRNGFMPDFSVLSHTDLPTDEGVQNQDGLTTGGRGQNHILAPRLEELILHDTTFLPERDSGQPLPAITRQSLLDSLSTRRGTHGHLTMTRCKIGITSWTDRFDSVMVWGDGGIHVDCDSESNEE